MNCTKSLGNVSGKATVVSAGLSQTSAPLPMSAQFALRGARKVSWNSSLIKSPPIGKKARFRYGTAHEDFGTSQVACKVGHVC